MTQAATFPVTGLPRTGLPARALVVGNPVHAERISRRLTGAREVAHVGDYRSFVGVWNGTPVLVVSHDIGAPGALCLLRDLSDAGVDTVIRLGIADALLRGIAEGDLIIAESCVRDAGLTSELVPESYPAAATPEVVLALAAAARERGAAHHRGVVWSRVTPTPDGVEAGAAGYVKLGVLAVEEELAALRVLSSTRGVRAGGALVIGAATAGTPGDGAGDDPHQSALGDALDRGATVALDALSALPAPD
jgi:uridine phosphorylase